MTHQLLMDELLIADCRCAALTNYELRITHHASRITNYASRLTFDS